MAANPKAPVYIFMHMYKTAGQTMLANLQLNVPQTERLDLSVGPLGLDLSKRCGSLANPGWVRERVDEYVREKAHPHTRLLNGHMAYFGIHELLPPERPALYFAFLRHPVERVNSLYNYLKYNSQNHWHHELVNAGWSLPEWLEHSPALWAHNGLVRQLLLGTFDQVSVQRELDPGLVQEAKRRLAQFWFVGLTETFSRDSLYLYGKLRFYRFAEEQVLNASLKKEQVTPEIYEQIAACNTLDLELYEYTRQLRRQMRGRDGHLYLWNILRAVIRRKKFRAGKYR